MHIFNRIDAVLDTLLVRGFHFGVIFPHLFPL
jgi:hypothetical protein